jgi:hypothetical protein
LPVSNGWTRLVDFDQDLNAPNVSPATGAVLLSATIPPLDLHSRLQQQSQHGLNGHQAGHASQDNTLTRDFARSPRAEYHNGFHNGSLTSSFLGYDGDIDSASS